LVEPSLYHWHAFNELRENGGRALCENAFVSADAFEKDRSGKYGNACPGDT
jgi:hypothetical protein